MVNVNIRKKYVIYNAKKKSPNIKKKLKKREFGKLNIQINNMLIWKVLFYTPLVVLSFYNHILKSHRCQVLFILYDKGKDYDLDLNLLRNKTVFNLKGHGHSMGQFIVLFLLSMML